MATASLLHFQKYFLSKIVILQLEYCLLIRKVSTETQFIGIHDVDFFNTEFAMHYGAISNMAVFGCFVSGERFCCCDLARIFHDKNKLRPRQLLFSF